jgi:hydrogenase/urease accessory protein HupE
MFLIRRLILPFACVIGLLQPVCGHQVETVEFEFQRLKDQWRLVGEMDIAYMLPETRMVQGGQPKSRKAVMKAAPDELARIRKETEKTLRDSLSITFAGKPLPWKIEFPDFDKKPFTLPEEYADWALLTVRIVVDAQTSPGDFTVHWSTKERAELIILTSDSEDGKVVSVPPGGKLNLVHVAGTHVAENHVADAGDKKPEPQAVHESASGMSPFFSWVWSGYRHVLPKGLDHMLFIVGLFLLALSWRPLLTQSLLFTIAHSITLAISVLGWVSLDPKLVEIFIAFSIAFIGIENLFAKKVGKLRYSIVFVFGLIHGLGFANVLAEKVKGIPKSHLTEPLLGFNLGVELAQISVLLVAFLLFTPLDKKGERTAQIIGSKLVAIIGTAWMIQRIFNIHVPFDFWS